MVTSFPWRRSAAAACSGAQARAPAMAIATASLAKGDGRIIAIRVMEPLLSDTECSSQLSHAPAGRRSACFGEGVGELALIERGVEAAAPQQVLVGPLLDDAT